MRIPLKFYTPTPWAIHPTITSWLFGAWGLDVVGPITPKSFAGYAYILAATYYFSKWAEVVPFKEAKKENVVNFIRSNIIYWYGVTRYIITNKVVPSSKSSLSSSRIVTVFSLKHLKNAILHKKEKEGRGRD